MQEKLNQLLGKPSKDSQEKQQKEMEQQDFEKTHQQDMLEQQEQQSETQDKPVEVPSSVEGPKNEELEKELEELYKTLASMQEKEMAYISEIERLKKLLYECENRHKKNTPPSESPISEPPKSEPFKSEPLKSEPLKSVIEQETVTDSRGALMSNIRARGPISGLNLNLIPLRVTVTETLHVSYKNNAVESYKLIGEIGLEPISQFHHISDVTRVDYHDITLALLNTSKIQKIVCNPKFAKQQPGKKTIITD